MRSGLGWTLRLVRMLRRREHAPLARKRNMQRQTPPSNQTAGRSSIISLNCAGLQHWCLPMPISKWRVFSLSGILLLTNGSGKNPRLLHILFATVHRMSLIVMSLCVPSCWSLSTALSWRVWAAVEEDSRQCARGTGGGRSSWRWWTAASSCVAPSDGCRRAVKWHSSMFWIAWSTTTGACSVICTVPGAIRSVFCGFLLDAVGSQYRWQLTGCRRRHLLINTNVCVHVWHCVN